MGLSRGPERPRQVVLHDTVAKADALKTDLAEKLELLAKARLDDWAATFSSKFPRQSGNIIFGMGSERVEIGGKQYNSWDTEKYTVLVPLYEAIDDVLEITNQYRLACPEDFYFGPQKGKR